METNTKKKNDVSEIFLSSDFSDDNFYISFNEKKKIFPHVIEHNKLVEITEEKKSSYSDEIKEYLKTSASSLNKN